MIEKEGGTWTGTGNAYPSAEGGRDFLVLNAPGPHTGPRHLRPSPASEGRWSIPSTAAVQKPT